MEASMNERQKRLADKVGRLTQRLETGVYDKTLSAEQNAKAVAEFGAIATRLARIIPEPIFSPEQRLERIAVAMSGAKADLSKLEPASRTLARLKARIEELVPGDDLTVEEKIDKLGDAFRAASPEKLRVVA
jgi:hypothetical protein